MKAAMLIFFIIVLAGIIFWLTNKLIVACIDLYYLLRAKKHPEKFPRTEGIVFNKKTRKLEADSRPILPLE